MTKSKFVWLNLETGEFSNSWTGRDFEDNDGKYGLKGMAKEARENHPLWKLIEYKCHSDEDFEFYNIMKLK